MPNHIHGIIQITENNIGTGQCPVPTPKNNIDAKTGQCPVPTLKNNIKAGSKFGQVTPGSISTIIGSFKSIVKKNCNKNNLEYFAWQPRFHDRIIRNENELNKKRQYIVDNPIKWVLDRNNLENLWI